MYHSNDKFLHLADFFMPKVAHPMAYDAWSWTVQIDRQLYMQEHYRGAFLPLMYRFSDVQLMRAAL
jgi:hypothetical protein